MQVKVTIPSQHYLPGIHFHTRHLSHTLYTVCLCACVCARAISAQSSVTFLVFKARQVNGLCLFWTRHNGAQTSPFMMSEWWIMALWTQYCAAFIASKVLNKLHKPQFRKSLSSSLVCVAGGSGCKTLHTAKFESLCLQLLNLCSASLSNSALSFCPLCSPLLFLFFDLVHSWKLLPRSLTQSCVFEAGEHPHTHTTIEPGSWLVLNPWQGALSLNIKDSHLRACRHDSHPGLSYPQQATWASNPLDVAGTTGGGWSDTVMSVVWAEHGCICHPAMCM